MAKAKIAVLFIPFSKEKKERDKWIEEVHNKEFPIQILNFDLS